MAKKNDKIGYGNPPKEHQFKKGQSGNPKGRPRKSETNRSLGQRIAAIVGRKMVVTIGKENETVDLIDAMLLKYAQKGVSGDKHALDFFTSYLNTENQQPEFEVGPEDEIELERALRDLKNQGDDDADEQA